VSGILYKSFNQIRVTVCLYGQGEEDAVVVVVVCPLLHPGPGVRRFLVQWSLNVSGILYQSFNHIRVTVCLYGQGEGDAVVVVVVVVVVAGARCAGTEQAPARQYWAVIGPILYSG